MMMRRRRFQRRVRRRLIGPWRNIHGAIWLFGLAIIAFRGWWWPGILILIGASMILEAVIMASVPGAVIEEEDPRGEFDGGRASVDQGQAQAAPVAPAQPAVPSTPAAVTHRFDLLPTNCPRCGAPLHGADVKWTSAQSADCPFCGSHLPMKA